MEQKGNKVKTEQFFGNLPVNPQEVPNRGDSQVTKKNKNDLNKTIRATSGRLFE